MTSATRLMQQQAAPFREGPDVDGFGVARRLNVPVWVFDVDESRIVLANPAACALWGASSEEVLRGRDMRSDMSSTVAKRLKQYQSDFLTSDETFTELWTLYPNGEPRSVMVVYRGYVLPDGRMAMQCEAVSETQDQPQNLRSAEALLHTDVLISLFSHEGPPLYLNPAARNSFSTHNLSFLSLFVDYRDCEALKEQLELLGEHRTVARIHTVAGQRWCDLSAKQCMDAATGMPAILLTAIDVTELKEARDTARHLADRDQLTGLYNRAYLQAHMTKLKQNRKARKSAVVFFDVDRFKLINDRLGHDAGDRVLQQIAYRTRAQLRPQDLVARLGGDEFVILFENVADTKDVEQRIARLSQALSVPVSHGGGEIDVSISVGIALFEPHKSEFNDVLRDADIALYASKQGGRNRATVFTEQMGTAAKARDDLELALKDAVDRDEFVLHYQPRLDIRSGKVVAVEGLVRWLHPDKGIVMPNAFISVCEETGLIDKLGRRVLELGVAQAIAWQEAGLDLNVSLNVSPRQFSDDRLLRTLEDLAAQPGFPTGKIELEITENVLSGDTQMVTRKLRKITEMGYRIAIDDFGTGYSNLSSISRFPLTCLKIDRSFIAQLPYSGPIVRLIITLADQIGATVVSEGVETEAQLEWLARHHCAQAQGYLMTHPLPPEDFIAYLQKGAAGC